MKVLCTIICIMGLFVACAAPKKTLSTSNYINWQQVDVNHDSISFNPDIASQYWLYTLNKDVLYDSLMAANKLGTGSLTIPFPDAPEQVLTFNLSKVTVIEKNQPQNLITLSGLTNDKLTAIRITANQKSNLFNGYIIYHGLSYLLVSKRATNNSIYYILYNVNYSLQSKKAFENGSKR